MIIHLYSSDCALMIVDAWQWFKGGQTNICYNALDRHVEAGLGDKVAFYWEGNDVGVDATLTYNDVLERVCQVRVLYISLHT